MKKNVKQKLVSDAICFIFGTVAIVLFYQNVLLVTTLLFIEWIVAYTYWHTRDDLYFFIAAAVVGPGSEIIAIRFGVWQYANPSFLGIPLWLPLAWGLAIMLIKRFVEVVLVYRKK